MFKYLQDTKPCFLENRQKIDSNFAGATVASHPRPLLALL